MCMYVYVYIDVYIYVLYLCILANNTCIYVYVYRCVLSTAIWMEEVERYSIQRDRIITAAGHK